MSGPPTALFDDADSKRDSTYTLPAGEVQGSSQLLAGFLLASDLLYTSSQSIGWRLHAKEAPWERSGR